MASPLFHRLYRRYRVQVKYRHSPNWREVEAFATVEKADDALRRLLSRNTDIEEGRVFDSVGQRVCASRGRKN